MIYNIRGTNGSGKTTLVRKLLGPELKIVTLDCGVKATEGREGVVAIGPYEESGCGGCDRIKTQAEIKAAVKEAANKYKTVLFEGIIVSTISGPYIAFAKELRSLGHKLLFCGLDTPIGECLLRVTNRNSGERFNETLVVDKYIATKKAIIKIKKAGFTVVKPSEILL